MPAYSPDGTKVIFASDRDHAGLDSIYVMNSDGSNQQALTNATNGTQDTQPAWSPDGTKIAFVSTRDSTTETWQETDDDGNVIDRSKLHINKEIYVMNADGSNQTRLTNDPANDDSPSWSSSGLNILFRSDRDRDCCDPTPQIWLMNADGSSQTNLSSNNSGDSSGSGTMIDFSDNAAKDGSSISVDASASLVIINFDGLAPNVAVTNQYQQIAATTFSSYPGGTVKTANDCSYLGSCPNGIIATSGFGSSFWPNADVYVNFAVPVNGLTFRVLGGQAGGASGYVDVYVNNSYYGTTSFFTGIGFPGQVLPPVIVNLSAVQHITAIKIRNVDNCGDFSCIFRWPVCYDDFAFNPELTANIISPRVTGPIDGTTPQKALIGANIPLQSSVSQPGGTYTWTFTGPPYVKTGGSESGPSITIRPLDTGTINAKLTYKLNGVSVSPSVNMTIVIPTLTSFWGDERADQVNRGLGCSDADGVSYSLGCSRNESEDGIIWHATAQIPTGTYLSDPAEGGIQFVQSGSPYRKRLVDGNMQCFTNRTASSEGYSLDGPYPYDADRSRYFSEGFVLQDIRDYDPPGLSVEFPDLTDNPPFPEVSTDATFIDDQFETYVVYFTTNPTNRDPENPFFKRIIGFQNSSHPFAALRWKWGGNVFFNYYSNPSTLLYTLQSNTLTGPIFAVEADTTKSLTAQFKTWTQCVGTTVTSNPIDGSRFFVAQLYKDFLERPPDQDGWKFWRSNITPCEFDTDCIVRKRIDVSRAFFYSTEFVGRHPALASDQRGTHDYNVAFVYACYRGFLRREPNECPDHDWSGFNFWVDKLDSTNPDAGDGKYNEMLKAFIESTEFRNRFVPHEPTC